MRCDNNLLFLIPCGKSLCGRWLFLSLHRWFPLSLSTMLKWVGLFIKIGSKPLSGVYFILECFTIWLLLWYSAWGYDSLFAGKCQRGDNQFVTWKFRHLWILIPLFVDFNSAICGFWVGYKRTQTIISLRILNCEVRMVRPRRFCGNACCVVLLNTDSTDFTDNY